MDEAFRWIAVALVIMGIFFIRRLPLKLRLIGGLVLSVSGWIGILVGLSIADRPFMQSETVAYTWAGAFFFMTLLGGLSLLCGCYMVSKPATAANPQRTMAYSLVRDDYVDSSLRGAKRRGNPAWRKLPWIASLRSQ